MTKRTLTDELRSVLLSHSLDAPEPEDTVTAILADTVGPLPGPVQPDAPDSTPAAGRRWWRPSGQLVMAACVVALIVLAAAGINTARHRDPAPAPASAAQGQVDQGQANQGQANQGQASQHGSDSGGGPMLVPRVTSGRRAAPANPPSHAGSGLDCSQIPGGRLTTGQWDDYTLSDGQLGYLYEFLCVGPNGQRSASEVQMFQRVGGTLRYVRTLLDAAAGQHLDFLVGGMDSVRIQASEHRVRPGDVPGAVVSMAWEFSDSHFGESTALVAEPCRPEDLSVTLTSVPGARAQSWLLVLGNRTATACALEGFPQARAQRGGVTLTTAVPTMSGPAGGVTKKPVPPIIVLAPGATASAIIEQSAVSTTGSCQGSDRLAVELPGGVSLGELKATVLACGLVVHPLVGNASGSD